MTDKSNIGIIILEKVIHLFRSMYIQLLTHSYLFQVLITPVFVVTTLLPQPLLLNVTSGTGRQPQRVKVTGRGSHQQLLHNMAADTAHTVTFQLR